MTDKIDIPFGEGLITDLDLDGYSGSQGKTIRTKTRNGCEDHGVRVAIRDVLGVLVEDGFATWDQVTGSWSYVTKVDLPPGQIWILRATAVNSHDKTTRQIVATPADLHLATEFSTGPWALAAGLGRWRNN